MAAKPGSLQRKSFFVDPDALARAKRVLRVASDAEAIRVSLERVAEMERFVRFMNKSRGKVAPDSFARP
jgi:hypothetical protein